MLFLHAGFHNTLSIWASGCLVQLYTAVAELEKGYFLNKLKKNLLQKTLISLPDLISDLKSRNPSIRS